jgi:hypothetical protein
MDLPRETPFVPPGLERPAGFDVSTSAQDKGKGPERDVSPSDTNSQLFLGSEGSPGPVMSYSEAIEEIVKQTGPFLRQVKSLCPRPVSLVLYDPHGNALGVSEGLWLNRNVSLSYLITWLQIYLDKFMAKMRKGDELIIKSVGIRFRANKMAKSYPGLEGVVSYSDTGGTVSVSVEWPCRDSELEVYWEAYRNMMQLDIENGDQKPVLKIKTVKFFPGLADEKPFARAPGQGHVFVVGNKKLDISQVLHQHEMTEICRSFAHLGLISAEQRHRRLSPGATGTAQGGGGHGSGQQVTGEVGERARGGTGQGLMSFRGSGASMFHGRLYGPELTVDISTAQAYSETEIDSKDTIASNKMENRVKENSTLQTHTLIGSSGTGQLEGSEMLPVGLSTVIRAFADDTVPSRPPTYLDPEKNEYRYQHTGGNPQMHRALPFDHDMSGMLPGTPLSFNVSSSKESAGHITTLHNSQALNNSGRGVLDRQTNDHELDELARGFSSDDDDVFFPAGSKSAAAISQKTNTTSNGTQSHYPNYTLKAFKGNNAANPANLYMSSAPLNTISGYPPPSRHPVSSKTTSTMNVNAPSFISPTKRNVPVLMMNANMSGFAGPGPIAHPPSFGFGPMVNINPAHFPFPDPSVRTSPFGPFPGYQPIPPFVALQGMGFHAGFGHMGPNVNPIYNPIMHSMGSTISPSPYVGVPPTHGSPTRRGNTVRKRATGTGNVPNHTRSRSSPCGNTLTAASTQEVTRLSARPGFHKHRRSKGSRGSKGSIGNKSFTLAPPSNGTKPKAPQTVGDAQFSTSFMG